MPCLSVDSCAFAPTSYKMDVISKYNLRPRKFINYNEDDVDLVENKVEIDYIFTDKETLINDIKNACYSVSEEIGINKIKLIMYCIKLSMILIENIHESKKIQDSKFLLTFIKTVKMKVDDILKVSIDVSDIQLIVGNNRDIFIGYKLELCRIEQCTEKTLKDMNGKFYYDIHCNYIQRTQ